MSDIPEDAKEVVALGEGVDVEGAYEAGAVLADDFDEGAESEGDSNG